MGNTLDDDRDVYGRRALFDELYEGRDRRVFLVGMRRTGKTATLLFLERRALADGRMIPLYIAPEGSETIDALRDRFANALSRRRKLLPGLPGGFLKLRKLPLDVLLLVAAESAEAAGHPLLVLIDEADALATIAESQPGVIRTLRAGLLADPSSRIILTGSRQAVRLRDDSFGLPEPLLAGFAQRTLAPVLDAAAARDLVSLRQRDGEGRVAFTDPQVALLLERTGGHPYLTQAACDQAKRLGSDPRRALDAVVASHPAAHAFQQDLERTSPSERLVLQAVMEGAPIPDWQEPFVRSLVDIGLLNGQRRLLVPVLQDFLARMGWDALPSRLSDQTVAPGASSTPTGTSPDAPERIRYRPIRVLGSGTFGEVLLMEAVSPRGVRRLVAIKLLRRGWANRAAVAERLRDEARIMALLRHRAIVRAEDIVLLDERLGVLMEYVPGIDLRDVVVQQAHPDVGLVPPRVVAEITAEVADALDVAYNRVPEGEPAPFRVLHRDIKPHNIRLTEDGEVKILDFGVAGAEFEGREHRSRAGGGGTLFYMAPERHLGRHNHPASDIFSLAVVITELASGVVPDSPWPTSPLALEACRVPMLDFMDEMGAGELIPLVAPMLEYEPRDRPTAAEVAAHARRLVRLLDGPDLRTWARRVVPLLRKDIEGNSQDPSLDSLFATAHDPQAGPTTDNLLDLPSVLAVEASTEKDP
ncbi:MAG: protein kinase [Alphaproteobacteria bacterium]|nr:protein kinase [Alphaproteobacteria bacterium]